MKTINLILLIIFGILMLFGLIGINAAGPEVRWVISDWKITHVISVLRATTVAIVGAIGFFTELLYFNLASIKNQK